MRYEWIYGEEGVILAIINKFTVRGIVVKKINAAFHIITAWLNISSFMASFKAFLVTKSISRPNS